MLDPGPQAAQPGAREQRLVGSIWQRISCLAGRILCCCRVAGANRAP